MIKRFLSLMLAACGLLSLCLISPGTLAEEEDFALLEGIWSGTDSDSGRLIIARDGAYVYEPSSLSLSISGGYTFNVCGTLHPVSTTGDDCIFIGDRRRENNAVDGILLRYDPASDRILFLNKTFERDE